MYTKLVEKMMISAPVGGKIRYHGANEAAGSPDSRTYFNFSLSQKLRRTFGFLGSKKLKGEPFGEKNRFLCLIP